MTDNGWTKITDNDWLQWRKIDASTDKAYIKNNESDCLAILLLVQCKGETEQLFLKDYLWIELQLDTDIKATHYRFINYFELPEDL
jgi:hypothetical protein